MMDMKDKKGQDISLTTIVLAVLALLVLVVLILIFTGRLGSFTSAVDESEKCDNYCKVIGKTGVQGNEYRPDVPTSEHCTSDKHTYSRGLVYEVSGTKYYCCCG